MNPADEVGGDYYDVLQHEGNVKIGIGDITGQGLESGVLMLMVQTAVRTILSNNKTDSVKFLNAINQTLYKNLQRMGCEKNLTLVLVDYQKGVLTLSGQHETPIVVRANGNVEQIDTLDLGFPIGLIDDITDFVAEAKVQLNPGDVVVFYTDGITEAADINGVQYGLDRLCEIVKQHWQGSATEIRQAIINAVQQHIGEQKVYDDITLLVLKQKN
jgi:phosphoserine phosphatase RsbU/P